MAQAKPRSTTRRAVLGATAAAPLITALPSPNLDDVFRRWEQDMRRMLAEADALPDDQWDQVDVLCAKAGDIEDLILQTPSSRRAAVEVKLRTLVSYFGNFDAKPSRSARDILAFVETLP